MIIIKNMDIPKGCQKCRLFRKHMFGNGLDYSYSCELGAKDFPMPWIRQQEERATDCPLEDLEGAYNLAKSTNNVGNQLRYDEYLRILSEQLNIELVTKEEVAKDVVCKTPYSLLNWLNTLTQLEECGYHIYKLKEVKDA